MLSTVFLFLNIGSGEMILILFAALMLFGGDKLPGLARGLGKGIRDFKDASEDVKREINNQINNYDEKKNEPLTTQTPLIENSVEHNSTPLIEEHAADDRERYSIGETQYTPVMEENKVAHTIPVGDNHVGSESAAVSETKIDLTKK
ncbi:twin arginine-targeting protein translocase, TatA/E family [Mucilaginibacter pineti]|uniref:Sec-independent protein translocase protein TatA n=1 Tax=Mucilaginibacter pineti TaxID=1391627 RepID=A0A1G7KB51_9SPHI|nr:twin-arginine translocase TatA/TatE family subunit [Mucilaginibacter pineti]SDF34069.1 twin arginine-targeting protein translocase, TatA/E family [Mucilaginibacter pineti]